MHFSKRGRHRISAMKSDYLRYIRESIPLPDVCGRLDLHIKGHGANARALCPFHNDRTPSLHIYQDHYHCYACQAHGDLFTLVQEVKGIDFQESVAWVEEQFPFVLGQKPVKRRGRQPDQTPAQIARDYYAQSHSKIPGEIAAERGYSPSFLRKAEVYGTNGNILCSHATREEQNGLLQAQLIQRDYQASADDVLPYQDYFFKERLLFTLRDISQRVIGFAGRSRSENDKPKYLYTKGLKKDTFLYRMDAVSARWNRARKGNDNCCLYVVEGLFDALRLESLGLDAAAVLGSRLTNGQLRILEQFAEQQRKWNRPIELRCFFDSDKAGIEGAYQALRSVWRSEVLRDTPLSIVLISKSVLSPEDNPPKDPDEFLKGISGEQASAWLEEHRLHPMEFLLRRFIDRDTLAFGPQTLESQWDRLSFLARVRILNQIDNLFSDLVWKDLLEFYADLAGPEEKCFAVDLLDQRLRGRAPNSASGGMSSAEEPYGSPYPLALEMARTGYQQEPMAQDDASWDRLLAGIELVGRVFDDLLPELRQMPPAQPLLAFNTPKDADQDRLKALPDHEELLLQHYLLNELLQEDIFPGYARSIPAVRYDPLLGGTYTTGLGYMDTFQDMDCKAVSFAYQVDMPVLRRERPPTDGLFRHYYDCWKDFISFLRDGIDLLEDEKIYRVKLDIRGYYDNIRKYSVRDVLIDPLAEAFGYSQNAFRRLKRENNTGENKQVQAEKITDILLDRLFGWTYLDPQTGARRQMEDPLLGIPQGPALSAYAANVLLFPLDRKVSQYVNQINAGCEVGRIRVRYARYVDDMVILASDPAVLANIEEMIHTYLREIELELSPKTDHPSAVDKEEARWWLLDERGGLGVSASQMAPEDILDELWGDGYEPYVVDRHDALNILKSAADILAAPERFDEAFAACFRTENIRYRDVSRLAALLLEHLIALKDVPGSLYDTFSAAWRQERQRMGTLRSILSRQDVEPLAFLEGLLILLQRNIPTTLPAEEQMSRQKVRREAALHIVEGTSIRQAEQTYRNTDGKNAAFLSVKVLQLNALAQVNLWRGDGGAQKGSHWTYTREKEFDSDLDRYLLRWQYVALSVQPAPSWDERPPFFDDFPKDESDDFQLFHHLTSCLNCCTKIEWFRELGSLFMGHTRSGVGTAPKIRQIERLWFLTGEAKNAVSPEDARLALQTLSNFLQQDYLPEVISKNPIMPAALFSAESGMNYLPVPPVPRQESSYPGIFAISQSSAYCADIRPHEKTQRCIKATDLQWTLSPDSVSERWSIYHAELEGGGWNALRSPLTGPMEEWTPHLAEEIADIYETLCSFLKKSVPLISKHHLFRDENGNLHALTYYQTGWTEPLGVALAGASRFLKWAPIGKGPGKADRAAALLLEDLLNLRQYPAEEGLSGDLLEVLSYGIGRLTGRRMQTYLPDLSENSFGQTVQRTIDTWRLFARTPVEQRKDILLEIALMDRLMAARLSWEHSRFLPGEDSAFMERWAVTTIQNECLRLNAVLLKYSAAPSLDVPLRRSVAAWRDIGCRLLQIEGDGFDAIHAMGSSALLRAVCLDIRMRVLECTWAMDSDEMRRLQARPLPLPLLQGQVEQAVLLFGSEDSQQEQAQRVQSLMVHYQSGHGNYQLEQITPAGWYLLLAWILELDGQEMVSPRLHPELRKNCGDEVRAIWSEAGALLFPKNSDSEEAPFPYDGLMPLLIGRADADRILERLHCLDEMLNFEIRLKCTDTLSFGRQSQLKTQISIRLEPTAKLTVPPQFVSVLHDGSQMPEYEGSNRERVWTQTVLDNQVLSVSAVTRKAAELAWKELRPLGAEEEILSIPCKTGEIAGATSNHALVEPIVSKHPAAETSPILEEPISGQPDLEVPPDSKAAAHDQLAAGGPPTTDPPGPNESALPDSSFPEELKKFQNAQRHSWTSRQNLNGNVDRIAFFQFDVDDSYVHPLAECCTDQENELSLPDFKRDPSHWNGETAKRHRYRLYSCSEYRRKKLLEAVFSACDQFKVDILVLPEYSVRMETAQWILETIKKRQYQFSVWAGTCRLAPGRKYEHEALKELNQESEDCKAILPIICTKPALSFEDGPKQEYPILYWKRCKKYPSISMEELINPHTRKLNPVMKDPTQLGGRLYGDARDDVMELICAEVFLATNPGNITAFAQVYDMLQKRFSGISSGIEKQMDTVRADLQTIGEHTSLVQMKPSYPEETGRVSNGLGKYGRTPILLVPAYTTRTVDYYVTGQAGYLATGLTTVFCNAVGLSSRGESCFIGTDCWERNDAGKSPFMPDYTPYHGALPGIYRQFDAKEGHGALGKEEQALVICDINPLAASGGRPRPESMLQPLILVAHLPIIESVTYRKATKTKNGKNCGPYDQCRCKRGKVRNTKPQSKDEAVDALYKLFAILNAFTSQKSAHTMTAYDWRPDELADALERLGIALKSPGLKERADCYRCFHQANPQVLPPATLLDWIWVDMDFPKLEEQKKIGFINVPKFTNTTFPEPNWE